MVHVFRSSPPCTQAAHFAVVLLVDAAMRSQLINDYNNKAETIVRFDYGSGSKREASGEVASGKNVASFVQTYFTFDIGPGFGSRDNKLYYSYVLNVIAVDLLPHSSVVQNQNQSLLLLLRPWSRQPMQSVPLVARVVTG